MSLKNKRNFMISVCAMMAAAGLAMPDEANAQQQSTTEMYYILDMKTDLSSAEIGNQIRKGLKKMLQKYRSVSHW